MAEQDEGAINVEDAEPLAAALDGDQSIETAQFAPPEPSPEPDAASTETPATDGSEQPDKSGSDEAGKPKDGGSWDKQRQQNDETRAMVRNIGEMVESIGKNQSQFAEQVREALLAQAAASQTAKPEDAEPSPLDKALDVLKSVDPEDADSSDVLDAVRAVTTQLAAQSTRPADTSALDDLTKRLDASEKRTTDMEGRQKVREDQDVQDAAVRRVNEHLANLDQKYSPGKKTFRSNAVKAAQEEMASMGFDEGKDPPESTFRVSLAHQYARLANEAGAAERLANRPASPDEDGTPFNLDPMTGGAQAAEVSEAGTADQVFADMRSEGHDI